MNKYQEALDDLSYPDINSPCYGNKCGETDCGDCNIKRDILTLKELVDKATANKAIKLKEKEFGYTHICPVCHSYVGTIIDDGIEYDTYCCSCGQKLDWSGEDVD